MRKKRREVMLMVLQRSVRVRHPIFYVLLKRREAEEERRSAHAHVRRPLQKSRTLYFLMAALGVEGIKLILSDKIGLI
jgi:hypothetical protein